MSKLQEARKAKKLSQLKLSAMVGISRQYLSEIETGKRVPSVQVAGRLCREVGETVEKIFPAV